MNNKLKSLLFIIPAALVAGLIFASLPATKPVLLDIPERLELVLPVIAEASDPDAEKEKEKPAEGTTSETEPETQEETTAAVNNGYADGVYTGSAYGYGGPVNVRVTIEAGLIKGIEITSAYGETEPYITLAKTVLGNIYAAQTWNVDVITGATYSSRGILGAVRNAITGESVYNPAPPVQEPKVVDVVVYEEPSAYAEGVYYGTAEGFGGPVTVEVEISNGKITSVAVVSAEDETPDYYMKAVNVIPQIISTQSPNVDVVSGATYSSTGIISAVKRAMAQAAGEEPETDSVEEESSTAAEEETSASAEPETAETKEPSTEEPATGQIGETQPDEKDNTGSTEQSSEEPAASGLEQDNDKESKPETDPGVEGNKDSELNTDPGAENNNDSDAETDPKTDGTQYKDGTYTASAICDDGEWFLYELTATVIIEDGKITSVKYAVTDDQSENPDDNDHYLEFALKGRTRAGVTIPGVPAQIISAQSADVDVVSGATYSSKAMMDAAAQAISKALK